MNEADHRLALQNALVIAKVVRFDYPNDWYASLAARKTVSSIKIGVDAP